VAVQYFTPLQAFTHQLLTHAIREALDSGRGVPCQSNPAQWDDSNNDPAICDGCPVIRLCSAYADTGAVEHGVIAGRRILGRPRKCVVPAPQEAA
jgi:hypothetical protein